ARRLREGARLQPDLGRPRAVVRRGGDPRPLRPRRPRSRARPLSRDPRAVCPSAEAALGYEYSLGGVLAALGDRRAAFEAEVREALAGADTSPHTARLVD